MIQSSGGSISVQAICIEISKKGEETRKSTTSVNVWRFACLRLCCSAPAPKSASSPSRVYECKSRVAALHGKTWLGSHLAIHLLLCSALLWCAPWQAISLTRHPSHPSALLSLVLPAPSSVTRRCNTTTSTNTSSSSSIPQITPLLLARRTADSKQRQEACPTYLLPLASRLPQQAWMAHPPP